MNTWTQRVLVLAAGTAIGAGAYGALRGQTDPDAELRRQVKALIAQHQQLTEFVRTQDERIEAQEFALKQQTERVDWMRSDVDGLLTRKPAEPEVRWIQNRFNRHEQRIGNLEHERWKQR